MPKAVMEHSFLLEVGEAGGSHVEFCAELDSSVGELRPRVAAEMLVPLEGFEVSLLCGGQVLSDAVSISELPNFDLWAVIIKHTVEVP